MVKNKKALEGYGRGAIEAEIDYASPHRIIQMLMEGATSKLVVAKGCISRGEIAEKGRQITWAIDIIGGLRSSLDMDKGGEISTNLDALYDYMTRQLLMANLKNDSDILDEVIQLLSEVKAGWDSIPVEFH